MPTLSSIVCWRPGSAFFKNANFPAPLVNFSEQHTAIFAIRSEFGRLNLHGERHRRCSLELRNYQLAA